MYHGNLTPNNNIKSWGCDMTYQWCHGPECHTKHTQDRIRGNKGNKVLRTRKIKQTQWNHNNYFSHFCSQGCWNDFMYKHWDEFIALHPRTEPLETPIDVQVETRTDYFGRPYKQKVIVDRPTEDVVG